MSITDRGPATLRRVLAVFFVGWLVASCAGELPPDGSYYDRDGDHLSDITEGDTLNQYLYHFNVAAYDADPSIAHGSRTFGWLEHGIHLYPENSGYYTYTPNPSTTPIAVQHLRYQWGTASLIREIELTGRDWSGMVDFTSEPYPCQEASKGFYPALELGAGDLSLGDTISTLTYFGGLHERHATHQNGLDVDVRFLRLDHQRAPMNLENGFGGYDLLGTEDLVWCFLKRNNVERIYIDLYYSGIAPDTPDGTGIIRHDANHRDHFHVLLKDPDGEYN